MSLIMDPDDPGYLDVVIGHKNLTDWEPDLETPVSSEQYFVYDMTNSAFAPGQTTISYTETATIAIENCPHTFVSTINGTINGG